MSLFHRATLRSSLYRFGILPSLIVTAVVLVSLIIVFILRPTLWTGYSPSYSDAGSLFVWITMVFTLPGAVVGLVVGIGAAHGAVLANNKGRFRMPGIPGLVAKPHQIGTGALKGGSVAGLFMVALSLMLELTIGYGNSVQLGIPMIVTVVAIYWAAFPFFAEAHFRRRAAVDTEQSATENADPASESGEYNPHGLYE